MDECEVSRKRGRWGNFYSRKCGVKRSPDEGNTWFSAHALYRHRCCLPTEGGALEYNRNATADILGKAYLTAGSSRHDSSSLAVVSSASPNRSSGVEENGAGYDIGRVNHKSLFSGPGAFSNVETRNDASVSEEKSSLKSGVIASSCDENKRHMGLNDGGALEDNRNGTLGKAYVTAGSSRQDSSSLVVGPFASPNRSSGVEYNGEVYDIGRVNHNSRISDPDAFSNVETGNDASCNENKRDMGLNDGGALEDNRNGTADILGQADLVFGNSRQDSSSLVVGPYASPNRFSGVKHNGAGYDIGRVNHNSLVRDPDAFSNVEIRDGASVLEDIASLKSDVIASSCNENKRDTGLNDGGALEDNRNGTADILGKAYLTAGRSRQDSSSLVVGPSASPNRSSGVEDNGAGYDIGRVNHNSLVSDPDAFLNVETRNDASVLEDKGSFKSDVIASSCNENKRDIGFKDGGALEDNTNGTADILGKVYLTADSSRQDSSSLVVGPSASPNRSSGVEDNGAVSDIGRVHHNALVSDPDAFSDVETRNDASVLEDKASPKSNVIASFCNENKHEMGLHNGGALEDNRKGTADILGKAYFTAGSSRQASSSLVGPSAFPNRSSGVEDNGAGHDIGRVNHNSLVSDTDAFSNVEIRNDASVLEDKASLKSDVIASFCNENKRDMGLNDGGVLEDNRNGTADILGKAYLTAGSSRQTSSSLVVGPSASPNQSSGFEDNGAGYDFGCVNDNSIGSDPDAFSNVETGSDASVLEDKASLKSEVIASFCNENRHDMGLKNGIANGVTPSNLKSEVIASFCNGNRHDMSLNDGMANGVIPSSLNAAVMLEDTAVWFDDQDRKIAGGTVACKLLDVPEMRMLHGEDALRSTQDCGVSKYQNSFLREKEETDHSTVDDIWGQVCGSQVVIMPSTNQCKNEERSIGKEDVDQVQPIQLKQNPEEIQDRSNDSITAKNAYERNGESSPFLKEGLGCLDKGVIQLKSSTDLDGFSPQNCQLDSNELVDHHNQTHRTGPILRSRRICLETSIAASVLKKRQRRLSASSSFKGTISRKTNFIDNKFKKRVVNGLLEDYLKVWMDKNMQAGALECEHCFPFIVHAPRRVECYQCKGLVSSGKEVLCTSINCRRAFHLVCAKNVQGHSVSKKKEFKCPQHVCMVCGSRGGLWRCVRCPVAVHKACSPWPEEMIFLRDTPGPAVCWRHHEDWRLDHKRKERTNNIKEAFHRLPIPYLIEDFKIERHFWKDVMGNENEPPPYVHVRRNVFLVKKKRDDTDDGVGCSCGRDAIVCAENCECRVQSMSCSKACKCSELCTNKPFRKEKKIKIVKTKFCGWGAEAAEIIKKGEFVIEYIGEVIDDALCEERLWEMKYRGVHNFYMCEIGKDFIIDATFKGNPSRFLNHSCDPNCKLEKWRVDGETRVGIFAAKDIMIGEPLTYDYRFIQFGPNVKCRCGAANCQGDLGEPFGTNAVKNGSSRRVNGESFGNSDARTPISQILEWGCKRKRSS